MPAGGPDSALGVTAAANEAIVPLGARRGVAVSTVGAINGMLSAYLCAA